MKLVILYRPKSEHGRTIETFVHDFRVRHESAKVELIDVGSREGAAMASLYDIMQYPALLGLADDGSVLKVWQGGDLPLMDEVASYTYA